MGKNQGIRVLLQFLIFIAAAFISGLSLLKLSDKATMFIGLVICVFTGLLYYVDHRIDLSNKKAHQKLLLQQDDRILLMAYEKLNFAFNPIINIYQDGSKYPDEVRREKLSDAIKEGMRILESVKDNEVLKIRPDLKALLDTYYYDLKKLLRDVDGYNGTPVNELLEKFNEVTFPGHLARFAAHIIGDSFLPA